MVKVNARGQKEVAQAYHAMNKRLGAGKGDLSRNNFSEDFRRNYDSINWRFKREADSINSRKICDH